MKGYYCDRCGRPFKVSDIKARKDEVLGITGRDDRERLLVDYETDLCDLCLAELYVWLTEKDSTVISHIPENRAFTTDRCKEIVRKGIK